MRILAAAAALLIAASAAGAVQFVDGPTLPMGFAAASDIEGAQLGRLGGNTEAGMIDYVAVSLIPEPAIWGLLVGGFSLVGMSARRRARRRSQLA